MATSTAIQPHGRFNAEVYNNTRQNNPGNAPALLQLPSEILEIIANFVGASRFAAEAATNLCRFGRVCVGTHLITHLPSCVYILNRAVERWEDDPKDPRKTNCVDGNGTIVSSHIRKFFM